MSLALLGLVMVLEYHTPTTDINNNPLTAANGLMGCVYCPSGECIWLPRPQPLGGQVWMISVPVDSVPMTLSGLCLNSVGWGPPANYDLDLSLTPTP